MTVISRSAKSEILDLGRTLEESIMAEVNELIEGLAETRGCSVTNVKDRFTLAVVNSLWFIVTAFVTSKRIRNL